MANKRYDQFSAVAPTTSRITLTADAATGALGKCTIQQLLDFNQLVQPETTILQLSGSRVINYNFGWRPAFYTSDFIMGTLQASFMAIWLPACTVTNIVYSLVTAGVFTGNNFNGFALYQNTGSTLVNLGVTANDPNFFKGTIQTWREVPLTSPVTVTAGIYAIGVLYNASAVTTNPHLAGFPFVNLPMNCVPNVGGTLQIYFWNSPVSSLAGNVSATSRAGISTVLIGVGVS